MLVFQQLADKIPENSTIGSLKPVRSRCCSSTSRVSFQCSWTRGPQKSLRGKRLILEISRSYVACLEKERGRGVPLCRVSPAAPHPQAWRVPPTQGWQWDRCGREPQAAFWLGLHLLSRRVTASALEKNIFIFQVFISSAFECSERLISEDHHRPGQQGRALTLVPALITLPLSFTAIMFN